jgi:hypothetical protein
VNDYGCSPWTHIIQHRENSLRLDNSNYLLQLFTDFIFQRPIKLIQGLVIPPRKNKRMVGYEAIDCSRSLSSLCASNNHRYLFFHAMWWANRILIDQFVHNVVQRLRHKSSPLTTMVLIYLFIYLFIYSYKGIFQNTHLSRHMAFVFASNTNPTRYASCTLIPRPRDHSFGVGRPIVYCNIIEACVVGNR